MLEYAILRYLRIKIRNEEGLVKFDLIVYAAGMVKITKGETTKKFRLKADDFFKMKNYANELAQYAHPSLTENPEVEVILSFGNYRHYHFYHGIKPNGMEQLLRLTEEKIFALTGLQNVFA